MPDASEPNPTDLNLPTVGWKEYVRLPDWGIAKLKAKIDTGARTSSIHVAELDNIDDDHVRFEVVVRESSPRQTVWVEAPIVRETVVKPSSGERQQRVVVKTKLRLGGKSFPIEATLVCRKGMRCRMLVGRTALAGRFVVDSSRAFVHRKPKPADPADPPLTSAANLSPDKQATGSHQSPDPAP